MIPTGEFMPTPTKLCAVCGQFRVWIFAREICRRKYYRDSRGREWNSNQCPTCKIKKANIYRKEKQAKMRAELDARLAAMTADQEAK